MAEIQDSIFQPTTLEEEKTHTMKVIKRDGRAEAVSFDKVIQRIQWLCEGKTKSGKPIGNPLDIDPITVAQKVINEIRNGITTRELDEYSATVAASMTLDHPDFGVLAGRIVVSNHHKNTLNSFANTIKLLYENRDTRDTPAPLISQQTYKIAINNSDRIEEEIQYIRDYNFGFFGFKTLERSYLIHQQTGTWKAQERPQHMFMRVALGIHGEDLESAFETYNLMSQGYFIHATPTLFNAGCPRAQMSSCFLMSMEDSLIDGIYKKLSDCAAISKYAGGIGIHISDIRAKESLIRGTNGQSNGIVPMLRVYNDTARYVDQCFKPETLIYTERGPEPISSLSVGDKVVSHNGSLQKITRVLCHKVKSDVLRINIKNSIEPIVVTGEHQVLALRNQKLGLSHNTIRNRLDNGYDKLEWIDAKGLNVHDYVCFPDLIKNHNPLSAQYRDQVSLHNFSWNNMIMVPVTEIGKETYDGDLYDLEVENDHTYVTANLGIVHNGGGKRMGSFAIYLEPWHAEILDFLDLKKNSGKEELRARDLFYALWMPDLFMKRLELANSDSDKRVYWSVFCPDECPGLADVYGDEFEQLYQKYESEGRARERYDIMQVWEAILDAQKETGTPYLSYKDHANRKSNQKNLGTIRSSNLCVAPETKILTSEGYYPIIDLENKQVEVWNGFEFSKTTVRKTGTNQELLKVTFSNGSIIECTPYHKFYIDTSGNAEFFEAKDLKSGMKIVACTYPDIESEFDTSQIITVTGIEKHGRISDTYCFTEPKRNLGIFNGVLLGNCDEIVQYSDKEETAVCNLGSVALPKHLERDAEGKIIGFDHQALARTVAVLTRNLNKVIDRNFYPIPETKTSNMRHRPMGIGVQGLADVFIQLGMPYDSPEALQLNTEIFETMYYSAVDTSNRLVETEGPYSTFAGSPASQGLFQFDLWGVQPATDRWDWEELRERVKETGLRNSLFLASMPTASTAQILGNTEAFEPVTYNVYVRRVLAGEFKMVNKYLQRDLVRLGLWTPEIRQQLIADRGSVQNIQEIPEKMRAIYKTAFELKQRVLIDMSAARGPYIDQSQSLNLFVRSPDNGTLTAMHLHGWKQGLKTGMYYLRREPIKHAQQFTVKPKHFFKKSATKTHLEKTGEAETEPKLCLLSDPDCIACQ